MTATFHFLYLSMDMPNGNPKLGVTPGLGSGELLGREGSVSPLCGCTLCLGLPYKNSVLKVVFNETTHCVLLHSLSSLTFD